MKTYNSVVRTIKRTCRGNITEKECKKCIYNKGRNNLHPVTGCHFENYWYPAANEWRLERKKFLEWLIEYGR